MENLRILKGISLLHLWFFALYYVLLRVISPYYFTKLGIGQKRLTLALQYFILLRAELPYNLDRPQKCLISFELKYLDVKSFFPLNPNMQSEAGTKNQQLFTK